AVPRPVGRVSADPSPHLHRPAATVADADGGDAAVAVIVHCLDPPGRRPDRPDPGTGGPDPNWRDGPRASNLERSASEGIDEQAPGPEGPIAVAESSKVVIVGVGDDGMSGLTESARAVVA